eukprot:2538457-Alexandrium_andersonii.AAC.1
MLHGQLTVPKTTSPSRAAHRQETYDTTKYTSAMCRRWAVSTQIGTTSSSAPASTTRRSCLLYTSPSPRD